MRTWTSENGSWSIDLGNGFDVWLRQMPRGDWKACISDDPDGGPVCRFLGAVSEEDAKREALIFAHDFLKKGVTARLAVIAALREVDPSLDL